MKKRIKIILIITSISFLIITHEWMKYNYEKRIQNSMLDMNYVLVDKSSRNGSSIWAPWTFVKAPVVDLVFVSRETLPLNDSIIVVSAIHTKFDEDDESFILLFNTAQNSCATVSSKEMIKQTLKTHKPPSDLNWKSLSLCEPWVVNLYLWIDTIYNGQAS